MTRLRAETQLLRDENARLGGHQNPLQRIHHLQAVKQERNALKLDNEYLRSVLTAHGIEVTVLSHDDGQHGAKPGIVPFTLDILYVCVICA